MATKLAFEEILRKNKELLSPDLYASDDMKVGIDLIKLGIAMPLLMDFIRLDPRGGIFGHTLLSASMHQVVDGDAEFAKHALE